MGRWRRTTACERAAQWISLELDEALGELEHAALHRHLGRCGACSASRAELGGLTLLIRAAPAVERRFPVSVPRARAARARLVRGAAAALVLAAALAAGSTMALLPRGSLAASSTALALATPKERLQFATAEHARIDPQRPAPPAPPVRLFPYAARALA